MREPYKILITRNDYYGAVWKYLWSVYIGDTLIADGKTDHKLAAKFRAWRVVLSGKTASENLEGKIIYKRDINW